MKKILLVDNYDSFTYIIKNYLEICKCKVSVTTNDLKFNSKQIEKKYDALVLSPGPNEPLSSGYLMQYIAKFENKIPILGVCLGHQAIGIHYGATLVKAKKPMHGKTSNIFHNNHFIFDHIPQHNTVCRYHSLIIDNIDQSKLDIIAWTEENEIMAVAHKKFPVIGLQFHPESVLTINGLKMIQNWTNFINFV